MSRRRDGEDLQPCGSRAAPASGGRRSELAGSDSVRARSPSPLAIFSRTAAVDHAGLAEISPASGRRASAPCRARPPSRFFTGPPLTRYTGRSGGRRQVDAPSGDGSPSSTRPSRRAAERRRVEVTQIIGRSSSGTQIVRCVLCTEGKRITALAIPELRNVRGYLGRSEVLYGGCTDCDSRT